MAGTNIRASNSFLPFHWYSVPFAETILGGLSVIDILPFGAGPGAGVGGSCTHRVGFASFADCSARAKSIWIGCVVLGSTQGVVDVSVLVCRY
jgi:hypothetical protein